MRRRFMLLAVGFFLSGTSTIFGQASSPHYPDLGQFMAVVINDVNSFGSLYFSQPATEECVVSDAAAPMIQTVKCVISEPAVVTISKGNVSNDGSSDSSQLRLRRLVYSRKAQPAGGVDRPAQVLHEYIYFGHWSRQVGDILLDSPARLALYFYESAPQDLSGFYQLDKYSTYKAIQAIRLVPPAELSSLAR